MKKRPSDIGFWVIVGLAVFAAVASNATQPLIQYTGAIAFLAMLLYPVARIVRGQPAETEDARPDTAATVQSGTDAEKGTNGEVTQAQGESSKTEEVVRRSPHTLRPASVHVNISRLSESPKESEIELEQIAPKKPKSRRLINPTSDRREKSGPSKPVFAKPRRENEISGKRRRPPPERLMDLPSGRFPGKLLSPKKSACIVGRGRSPKSLRPGRNM